MEIIYNTDDVLLMLQAQREQIEKRITPEMELDERKKYIHEIEEINKQIRKRNLSQKAKQLLNLLEEMGVFNQREYEPANVFFLKNETKDEKF